MRERNETIIMGVSYLLVFVLFLVTAVFFREYYWYYIFSALVVSAVTFTLYRTKAKQTHQ